MVSQDNRRQLTREHRFKTRAEMVALVRRSAGGDAQQRRDRAALLLPAAHAQADPAQFHRKATDEAAELRAQADGGPRARASPRMARRPADSEEDLPRRLEFELSIIERMKFPGYFLIVSDFIKWAKAQGIPVGPGRGSGAGSLVAYALTITDLDPIRFSLLFERFLNPGTRLDAGFRHRLLPDPARRGDRLCPPAATARTSVAQIITFGSFLARGVLRNVGRVLEMPLGLVDKLAKMVPQNPAAPVSLKQAIDTEPRLQEAAEQDSRVRQLLEIAQKLEGLYSNASTHAAGIVIGDRPLDQLVPLYRDPKSDMPATQYQYEMGRAGGAGQIRLPRPEDPHHALDLRRNC